MSPNSSRIPLKSSATKSSSKSIRSPIKIETRLKRFPSSKQATLRDVGDLRNNKKVAAPAHMMRPVPDVENAIETSLKTPIHPGRHIIPTNTTVKAPVQANLATSKSPEKTIKTP